MAAQYALDMNRMTTGFIMTGLSKACLNKKSHIFGQTYFFNLIGYHQLCKNNDQMQLLFIIDEIVVLIVRASPATNISVDNEQY